MLCILNYSMNTMFLQANESLPKLVRRNPKIEKAYNVIGKFVILSLRTLDIIHITLDAEFWPFSFREFGCYTVQPERNRVRPTSERTKGHVARAYGDSPSVRHKIVQRLHCSHASAGGLF